MGALINRIDHLVLTVRSLDATCDWYGRALGFVRQDTPGKPTALLFGPGAASKLNIHQQDHTFEPKAVRPTGGAGDFCIITETRLEQVADHLRQAGIPVEQGPVERTGALGAMHSLYLRDPDGNLVEISRYA